MQRITITLEDELLSEIDRMVGTRGYQNRSEAIRDLARAGIRRMAEDGATASECVAALVYVYDHAARDLPKRLIRAFHEHHDLSLAAMHMHLDHDSCMEVTVLKGATREVRQLADRVIAERGVRHGRLVVVPVALEDRDHAHGAGSGHSHQHVHVREAG